METAFKLAFLLKAAKFTLISKFNEVIFKRIIVLTYLKLEVIKYLDSLIRYLIVVVLVI